MDDLLFSISEDYTKVVQDLMGTRKKFTHLKKILDYAESISESTTATKIYLREWRESVDWAKEQVEKISADFSLCAHNTAFYADSFQLKKELEGEEEWPV